MTLLSNLCVYENDTIRSINENRQSTKSQYHLFWSNDYKNLTLPQSLSLDYIESGRNYNVKVNKMR